MSVRKDEIAFSPLTPPPPPSPVLTRPRRLPSSLMTLIFFFFFYAHHGYFVCSLFTRRCTDPSLSSCGNKPPRCLSQVAFKKKKGGKKILGRHCGLVVTLCHVPERRGRAPKNAVWMELVTEGLTQSNPSPHHHPKYPLYVFMNERCRS